MRSQRRPVSIRFAASCEAQQCSGWVGWDMLRPNSQVSNATSSMAKAPKTVVRHDDIGGCFCRCAKGPQHILSTKFPFEDIEDIWRESLKNMWKLGWGFSLFSLKHNLKVSWILTHPCLASIGPLHCIFTGSDSRISSEGSKACPENWEQRTGSWKTNTGCFYNQPKCWWVATWVPCAGSKKCDTTCLGILRHTGSTLWGQGTTDFGHS